MAFHALMLPNDAPDGPVMVHSDVSRTHALVKGIRGRENLLEEHVNVVNTISDNRDIWFAAFNYDFLSGKTYSARSSIVQVGALNEHFRTRHSEWRTLSPAFNFAGIGIRPEFRLAGSDFSDPFGPHSDFGQLVEGDGTVLWYGADYGSATIHHLAETLSGGPAYRYTKSFRGLAENDPSLDAQEMHIRYHVRPLGGVILYDMARLEQDAVQAGIIRRIEAGQNVFWAPARALVESWTENLRKDPFYMLTEKSRVWAEQHLQRLGRPFFLSDFEPTIEQESA
ncbi:hypothetical protein GCM10027022_13170 [Alpinimonas psychrophila]|uniref:Aminoglycoside N(3)-acetyltransferase n=1 Tax=Alpinimonas psychrophila TaxID=748908 RepID=A0A7W3PP91_9MICO|nr:AAC(3) family N-acetyltransferase [Alpinimonas psychrophila]MBA8829262.1 aminoglycoside N3'-acetyltransferase [Alpinimonas psychrophila]